MNGTALALVLAAAIVHAAWNLAAKRVRNGGATFVFLYYTVSAFVCVPIATISLLARHQRAQWILLIAATLTALFHVGYGVVLQRGYTVGDLSVVYPLARGSGPLLSVFAAVVLLGERPGALGLAGAVLDAMRMAPVSLVAPAREVSIVLGGLAAWLVLGEADPVRRLTGSVIVLAGIAAIAVS